MSKKKQYSIAGLILLLGFAVSYGILFGGQGGQDAATDADNTGVAAETTENIAPEKEGSGKSYTVRFYDQEGGIISDSVAAEGTAVLPPDISRAGWIFKGWDQPLHDVTSDMEVYPCFEQLSDAKNIMYADCVYANIEDDICVLLQLGGQVDCSQFLLDLAYDTDLLQCTEVEPLIPGLTAEIDEEIGVIRLELSASSPLQQATTLAKLHFCSDLQGDYHTNLPLLAEEIYTITDGRKIYTDSTAHDAKIYLFY